MGLLHVLGLMLMKINRGSKQYLSKIILADNCTIKFLSYTLVSYLSLFRFILINASWAFLLRLFLNWDRNSPKGILITVPKGYLKGKYTMLKIFKKKFLRGLQRPGETIKVTEKLGNNLRLYKISLIIKYFPNGICIKWLDTESL